MTEVVRAYEDMPDVPAHLDTNEKEAKVIELSPKLAKAAQVAHELYMYENDDDPEVPSHIFRGRE